MSDYVVSKQNTNVWGTIPTIKTLKAKPGKKISSRRALKNLDFLSYLVHFTLPIGANTKDMLRTYQIAEVVGDHIDIFNIFRVSYWYRY